MKKGCDSAKVISVIETKTVRGSGTSEKDIARVITEYWTLDGEKLAEIDPVSEQEVGTSVESCAYSGQPMCERCKGPLYVCDPQKNTSCWKKHCLERHCGYTRHPEYAKDATPLCPRITKGLRVGVKN